MNMTYSTNKCLTRSNDITFRFIGLCHNHYCFCDKQKICKNKNTRVAAIDNIFLDIATELIPADLK